MKSNLIILMVISIFIAIGICGVTPIFGKDTKVTANVSPSTQINNDSDTTNFLFIQSALSGSLAPTTNNNAGNSTSNQKYILTLNNVSSSTMAFSDRPQRIVSPFDTQTFVNDWNIGQDSFKSDPPNAALVLNNDNKVKIIVFELFNPQYNKEKKTIEYNVMKLDIPSSKKIILSDIGTKSNTNSSGIVSDFRSATLFIDAGCSPWDPRC